MLPRRFREALKGNFTAHIPRQLTVFDLRMAAAPPEAVGFPHKIIYSERRRGLTMPQPRAFMAEYRPRFETFIHAGSFRKLTYTWVAGGLFHVDVLHNREDGQWNIYKFSAGRLISHVAAQGYGEAMIHTTGAGLAEGEPAFTFLGEAEECDRENRAQVEYANAGEYGEEADPAANEDEKTGLQTLVFGIIPAATGNNLVFVPREKAEELAAIREALTAKTWGEFKLRMPARRLPELLTTFLECGAWPAFDLFYQARAQVGTRPEREALWREYQALVPGERMPMDDDIFRLETVPGAGTGNWPERPEQAMLRWLPPRICGRFGRRVSSRRGDYLIFDPLLAPEILAALEGAGYSCCWNEDLVGRACGTGKTAC